MMVVQQAWCSEELQRAQASVPKQVQQLAGWDWIHTTIQALPRPQTQRSGQPRPDDRK
jgi:hypothetical protein